MTELAENFRSQISVGRQMRLFTLCEQLREVPGDVIEVGVWRGGTARQLCQLNPWRTVYLFDTFSGMPKPDHEIDQHREGDFADTSFADVREYLSDCPNASIFPGLFPGTARGLEDRRFALAHVDCDLYASTRSAIDFIWPRLNFGGVMVLDDYKSPQCRGATLAIREFAERQGVEIEGNAPHTAGEIWKR